MDIIYKVNEPISVDTFVDLLTRSTLGERRPVTNTVCMQGMLDNSNLIVSAWQGTKLVGIARCITDFHYCCYLSDLAVDAACQRLGMGKQLQAQVLAQLEPTCKLLLIAAPKAKDYYPKLGYSKNERCWELPAGQALAN
ncbi:GNAT family N-acetyltransferase [Motilimonas eburnea]|uniref:GNAT family N-acetyltransferase n=1 Tax=Motilimonas eburnea TaxID=1737488 RepID=UPI001E501CBE|nr:GNAT family N-acetyltransferase [Motilimonas eburnea]MCE2572472.1 GNAT family N-acetyltransferase [Motilimonas eburnea]